MAKFIANRNLTNTDGTGIKKGEPFDMDARRAQRWLDNGFCKKATGGKSSKAGPDDAGDKAKKSAKSQDKPSGNASTGKPTDAL